MNSKTKLVVVDENALGYIDPTCPTLVNILEASILRGACVSWGNGPYPVSMFKTIRVASENDFSVFRVSFTGYNNGDYEFAPLSEMEGKLIASYVSEFGEKPTYGVEVKDGLGIANRFFGVSHCCRLVKGKIKKVHNVAWRKY